MNSRLNNFSHSTWQRLLLSALAALAVPLLLLAPPAIAGVPVLRAKESLMLRGEGNTFKQLFCQSSYPADGGFYDSSTGAERVLRYNPPWKRGVSFRPDGVAFNFEPAHICPSGKVALHDGEVSHSGFGPYTLSVSQANSKATCTAHRLVRLLRDGTAYASGRFKPWTTDLGFQAPNGVEGADGGPGAAPTFPPGYYTAIAPQVTSHARLQKLKEVLKLGARAPHYKVIVICPKLKLILGRPAAYKLVITSW